MSTLKIWKGTALNTTKVPVVDGQLLFETDTKKIWLDDDTSRLQVGGQDTIAWNNIIGKPSTFTPADHYHTRIASLGNYTFDSTTLPLEFDMGLSCGFVNSDSGFGGYGGVITHRAYTSGGGSLQLYSPYSANHGGTHLKARFGNYAVGSGNSWTELKSIAWIDDIPTKTSQLTNDSFYFPLKGGTTIIPDNSNLNSYTTPGLYTSGSSTNAATLTNPPTASTGFKLFVVDGYISGRVTQFATGNSHSLWYRQYNGSSWTGWASPYTNLNKPTLSDLGITTFVKSGSGAKAGLVPAPSTTAGTTKYLREDGTWTVPPDTNTTYSAATTSANGLMTAAMVTKLNGIATGANAYSHPTSAGNKHIPAGGSSGQILRWSAAGTAVWGADNNTTYSAATQSAAGLMSAADKKKLDGLSAKGFAPTLLWTNPSPSAEFGTDSSSSTTDVSVTLTGVNWIGIIFKVWHSSSLYSQMLIFPTDSTRMYGIVAGANTENIASRRLTIYKSSNKITFGYGSSNGDNMHYYDGMFGVPYQIYAIG